jgi:hypothetical protein
MMVLGPGIHDLPSCAGVGGLRTRDRSGKSKEKSLGAKWLSRECNSIADIGFSLAS